MYYYVIYYVIDKYLQADIRCCDIIRKDAILYNIGSY